MGGWQALCSELSNQPILEVLLSMTLQCSGTACTSINSIINNCFVSGFWAATSKSDWPQIGLEAKGKL